MEFPPTAFLLSGDLNSEWALCGRTDGGVRSWCRWWVHQHDPTLTPRHQEVHECGSPGQVWRWADGVAVEPSPAGWTVSECAPPGQRCGYSPEGWRQTHVPYATRWGEPGPDGQWKLPGEGILFWAEQWLTYPPSFHDPTVWPPDNFVPLTPATFQQGSLVW